MKLDKISFLGEIKGGLLHYKEEYFKSWIAKYEDCKVKIVIERIRSIRSLSQNRFYWAFLRIISEKTGHEPKELHEAFKMQFLAFGSKNIYGKEIIKYKSTTRLSIGEFIDYMVKISILTEIELPNPEEYWEENLTEQFRQSRKKYAIKN